MNARKSSVPSESCYGTALCRKVRLSRRVFVDGRVAKRLLKGLCVAVTWVRARSCATERRDYKELWRGMDRIRKPQGARPRGKFTKCWLRRAGRCRSGG